MDTKPSRAAAVDASSDASPPRSFSVSLFGCPLDTGNHGVSALGLSSLGALVRRGAVCPAIFDFGRGMRETAISIGQQVITTTLIGSAHSRRLYRQGNPEQLLFAARLGVARFHPVLKRIVMSECILDISGGDSFSDIYGPRRFRAVTLSKLIAIQLGLPLILLPQTYGPFTAAKAQRTATKILRRSAMAWARDERSYEILRELLGDAFDPQLHRVGVDVAFALECMQPRNPLAQPLDGWLKASAGPTRPPLVGVNISGLIYNDPEKARSRYAIRADYRKAVIGLVQRILADSEARIVFIPHVVTPPGHYESDIEAAEQVAAAVDAPPDRLAIAPAFTDPREVKWLISKLDWFCGTRMHSTIAALSSGVPCASIAYSDKTLGVFETCGQGGHVIDPRTLDTQDVIDRAWQSLEARDETRLVLQAAAAKVVQRAEHQMDEIVSFVGKLAEQRRMVS